MSGGAHRPALTHGLETQPTTPRERRPSERTRLRPRPADPSRHAARRGDDGADLFQHQDQSPTGVGLVIDHEHAQAVESNSRKTVCDWGVILKFTLAITACDLPPLTFLSYPHRPACGATR